MLVQRVSGFMLLVLLHISGALGQFVVQGDGSEDNKIPTPCFVPSGRLGFCVSLSRCRHLKSLIEGLQKPLPGDVSLIIKDSFFCPKDEEGGIQVCCLQEGIEPPIKTNFALQDREGCSLQSKEEASCVLYNRCSPFLQLLSNLKRPFPAELPQLMSGAWLCGIETLGGFNLPQICCPTAAVDLPAPTEPPSTVDKLTKHPKRELLASSDKCGPIKIDSKIVGGQEAPIGEYPWLANLGYQLGTRPEVEFKCGGSLIAKNYVLTAAHCVTGLPGSFSLTTVRVGEHRLSTVIDCNPTTGVCNEAPQDFKIAKVVFHPEYNKPDPFRNDIALIKLNGEVKETEFVAPICLPFLDTEVETYIRSASGNPQEVVVAGWGATNEKGKNPADALQFLNVTVTDGQACQDIYKTRGGTIDPSKQLCAGGEKGRDSCVGDSGSALMLQDKNSLSWKIIGVVSFGPRLCGTQSVPGVYTKVRTYMEWILDTVEP